MTTPRPRTHLCIATGQNLANLIPALQLSAERVIILETPQMRAQAAFLQSALKIHGIEVVREAFDDSTPQKIEESAEQISLKYGEGAIVFNCTGGTKLMTLALDRHMRVADDLHLLYAETARQRIDWLHPAPQQEIMEDILTIDDFLSTQGYVRTTSSESDGWWQQDVQTRAELTRMMGDHADKYARFFGVLNHLAGNAMSDKNALFRPQQTLKYPPDAQGKTLLEKAQAIGLLHWDKARREIVFHNEDAARYFGGGWLEEYVWLKLRGLKPKHDAIAINLTVQAKGAEEVRNELDAVFAHANRLLVIECKTARFGRDSQKDANYIYKLSQLSRKIGGKMAASLLLSARDLDEAAAERAQRDGVYVLAGEQLRQLVAWMKDWMAGKTAQARA